MNDALRHEALERLGWVTLCPGQTQGQNFWSIQSPHAPHLRGEGKTLSEAIRALRLCLRHAVVDLDELVQP